ncbi:MAG TPA: efflux transporter outer membrane subunit [Candidatus Eisenbacteria bacterium]|nr:efflux transporter outer membrane subunit [Candidatus Eisenbacteria bacterium]
MIRKSSYASARQTGSHGQMDPRGSLVRSGLASVLCATLLLSGCAVGPKYSRPKVVAPAEFRGAEGQAEQASYADEPWWVVFKDDQLKSLIDTALANNYDLGIAVSRVEQSRQLAAVARSQYLPAVNYSVGASDGKNEFLGTVAPGSSTTKGAFLALGSVAWEADIWGRIRRLNEAARAQYLATEEARRGVMLSLTGAVAQAYFELLGLELQLQIAKETTASFGETLKLFTQRYEGGVASKLDTSRAEAAEASAAAAVPEYERLITLKENQISVLIGANPEPILHSAKLLDEVVPPDIPVGLPSQLLERRPDVLSAEEQVRAANAQVGVAIANFFPRFGLTALLGQASTPLSEITSSSGNIWSIAGNFAGPIYEGGALTAQKRQAVAAWEASKLQYQQTALNAFTDVSNALVSRQKFELIQKEEVRSVAAYQEAVTVSLQRYNAGKASYFEVLDAQLQLYPEQNSLAVTELNRRVVIVQLYLALGGGWNLSDADWKNHTVTPPATNAAAPNH